MDLSTLEGTWRKQVVTGNDVPAKQIAARMKREVAIAQRRIQGGIVIATFLLFAEWAAAILVHFISPRPLNPVAFIAHVVNSILLILFLVRAFRSRQAVRSEIRIMGGTLEESVGATLRTVELQIKNAQVAGYAIPAAVAVAVWLFLAKYLAGDIPGFGAVFGSVFMAGFGLIIGGAIWHRYRTHLAPHREELRKMLHTLISND